MLLNLKQLDTRLILELVLPNLLIAFLMWFGFEIYGTEFWFILVFFDLIIFLIAFFLRDKTLTKEKVLLQLTITFFIALITWELIALWLGSRNPNFRPEDRSSLQEHLIYSIPLAFWSMSWFGLLHYNKFRRKIT